MLDSANELQVPLPLTALTQQMFQAAIATGHGDEDICSTIKVLEEIVGVEVETTIKIIYRFLLHSRIPYTNIGIKPGRQLPPKRD